jgi:nucleotide-binding universal stress UspA family protein
MPLKRVRIERILCATDFSASAERALGRAVSMARWFKAQVTVLHAIAPVPWIAPGAAWAAGIVVPQDVLRPVRGELAKALEGFVAPFRAEGIALETRLDDGDPASQIEAVAEALPADLVVMGTHARAGFERLLLGSVAEKVLRRAPCPVLIVGATDPVSPDSPLFRRILCAADLTPRADSVLSTALSVAAETLAHVTLLHVVERLPGLGVNAPATTTRGLRPISDLEALQARLLDEAREQLVEAARPARDFCEVSERVETGKAWPEILRVAEEIQADLIVIGSRGEGALGRLFLGSTANQVVRQATCPVLVVRGSKDATSS